MQACSKKTTPRPGLIRPVAASENSDMLLFAVDAEMLLVAVFAAFEHAKMQLFTVLAASENAEMLLFTVVAAFEVVEMLPRTGSAASESQEIQLFTVFAASEITACAAFENAEKLFFYSVCSL